MSDKPAKKAAKKAKKAPAQVRARRTVRHDGIRVVAGNIVNDDHPVAVALPSSFEPVKAVDE